LKIWIPLLSRGTSAPSGCQAWGAPPGQCLANAGRCLCVCVCVCVRARSLVRARVRGPTAARMSKQTSTNVHVRLDRTYIMHPHLLSRSPPRPAPLPLPFPILVCTPGPDKRLSSQRASVYVRTSVNERAIACAPRAWAASSAGCASRRARVLAGLLFAARASSRKADRERRTSSLLGSAPECVPVRVEICADTHTLHCCSLDPRSPDWKGIGRRALCHERGCNTVRTRAHPRDAVMAREPASTITYFPTRSPVLSSHLLCRWPLNSR
jgi:hypothetical protein